VGVRDSEDGFCEVFDRLALSLRPASARSRVLRARRRLRALLDKADNPGRGPAAQVPAASSRGHGTEA
jgi:hypothetical protein